MTDAATSVVVPPPYFIYAAGKNANGTYSL
jgi:hypothetical protein